MTDIWGRFSRQAYQKQKTINFYLIRLLVSVAWTVQFCIYFYDCIVFTRQRARILILLHLNSNFHFIRFSFYQFQLICFTASFLFLSSLSLDASYGPASVVVGSTTTHGWPTVLVTSLCAFVAYTFALQWCQEGGRGFTEDKLRLPTDAYVLRLTMRSWRRMLEAS